MWTVLNGSVGTCEDVDCFELVEERIQRRVYIVTVFGSVKMDRFFCKNLVISLYSVVS